MVNIGQNYVVGQNWSNTWCKLSLLLAMMVMLVSTPTRHYLELDVRTDQNTMVLS